MRVSSTNQRADAELRADLQRVSRGESYDEQAMPGLDSEAIDFRAASELFSPIRKLQRGDLDTLHLMTRHQGHKVPTVAGMPLFGKARKQHFPDAWIQAGRFRGTDRSQIDDRAEIHDLPVRAAEAAIAFVHKHMNQAAEIGTVRRVDRWTLPPTAVREAVINAVVLARAKN